MDINILPNEDKLKLASKLAKEISIPSIEEEDIYELMNRHSFKTDIQVEKAMRAMAYIRLRDFEGYTRVDAFKKVYPDRWEPGDTDKAIGARARRIEDTAIYKKIILEMQMNFYNIFAVERVHVVNEALKRAYDRNISEKYNFEYMKLFLESTRKPDEAKGLEVNVNIESGGISIADVEERLNLIANKLDGNNQGDIVDAILIGESNDPA